jgi:hypothetical protein
VCTGLLTTSEFPLIVRSCPDNEVHIRSGLLVASQHCLRAVSNSISRQVCTLGHDWWDR